jgi:DNA-directed RNA polymerase subunit RPC12/RpoP
MNGDLFDNMSGMTGYEDRELTCRECGKPFVFTKGEQEFFADRGFNDPVRCSNCRKEIKLLRKSKNDI